MSLTEKLAADRRLVELRALLEDANYRLLDSTICTVVAYFGMTSYRDVVRGDLTWLEQQALLKIERTRDGHGGEIWIATLTQLGVDVANGRHWPGVARPDPV